MGKWRGAARVAWRAGRGARVGCLYLSGLRIDFRESEVKCSTAVRIVLDFCVFLLVDSAGSVISSFPEFRIACQSREYRYMHVPVPVPVPPVIQSVMILYELENRTSRARAARCQRLYVGRYRWGALCT